MEPLRLYYGDTSIVGSITIGPEHRLETIANLARPGASGLYRGGVLTVEGVSDSDLALAVTNYFADEETHALKPERAIAKQRLTNLVYASTLGRYSQARQQLFHALLTEALADGLENRATYIRKLLTWLKTAAAALIQAEDRVDALASVELIRAVDVDLDQLKTTDPEITVRAALYILD